MGEGAAAETAVVAARKGAVVEGVAGTAAGVRDRVVHAAVAAAGGTESVGSGPQSVAPVVAPEVAPVVVPGPVGRAGSGGSPVCRAEACPSTG